MSGPHLAAGEEVLPRRIILERLAAARVLDDAINAVGERIATKEKEEEEERRGPTPEPEPV